ncbi:hypothetical protein MPTK1_8g02040 [Marchantia polymorpha subsp. ruderalis]|uniref:Uncharacterized protein n=1 Tax=Marchantia polymorpha TaxID=3197 RepID=A0A2R6XIS8_MARPO|nr:hypothetical protein MARPO_0012s0003 [Marchantia polymorpha]BBN18371.1 hypothetical protein Mp_8g02040 [Marchantia polymorpha subsp. ruderalis]|eukprot:PTQ46020.1 hypothetical protein MARPO_0012s0003 [Marchantia polymorpha]
MRSELESDVSGSHTSLGHGRPTPSPLHVSQTCVRPDCHHSSEIARQAKPAIRICSIVALPSGIDPVRHPSLIPSPEHLA